MIPTTSWDYCEDPRRRVRKHFVTNSLESTCNVGDLGLIPGLGRSPGEGNGYPLQYSGLENSMDCIVHGVAKSRARLSDFNFSSLYSVSGRKRLVALLLPIILKGQLGE